MKFLKYPKLLDSRLLGCEVDYPIETYNKEVVSTEKIHGTNFGFYVSKEGTVKYASRTVFKEESDLLTKESMHKHLLSLLDTKELVKIGLEVIKKHQFEYVIFNGELFGEDIFKMEYIQVIKGEHEIKLFSVIGVNEVLDDGSISATKLAYDEMVEILPEKLLAPFEFRGLYTEALKLADLSKESSFGGQREGYVLMPTEEITFNSETTYPLFAVKVKGKEFLEVCSRDFVEARLGKYNIKIRERHLEVAKELLSYATVGRFENVISHTGKIYTIREIKQLTEEVQKDILHEYLIIHKLTTEPKYITETMRLLTGPILLEVKEYLLAK